VPPAAAVPVLSSTLGHIPIDGDSLPLKVTTSKNLLQIFLWILQELQRLDDQIAAITPWVVCNTRTAPAGLQAAAEPNSITRLSALFSAPFSFAVNLIDHTCTKHCFIESELPITIEAQGQTQGNLQGDIPL